MTDPLVIDSRFLKLSRTPTFRENGLAVWSSTTLGIVGAGMLGDRLAREAILSGVGEVRIWDFDQTEPHNLGNQFGRVGQVKVQYLAEQCDAIRPGRVRAFPTDVRHAGIRQLQQCDILIDCSDDPRLVWPLTEISNGLELPLLRAAVDGTGQMEMGRVLASGAAAGTACQLCSFSLEDLIRHRTRRGCPAGRDDPVDPTLAGGALGSVVAGVALLQAQRLRTGNDREHVIDREVLVDLSNMQLLEIKLERSAVCLSGHRRWSPTPVDLHPDDASLNDLFTAAKQIPDPTLAAHDDDIELSFYLHPLNIQASCSCGTAVQAVGTQWAAEPECPACQTAMQWLEETQIDQVSRQRAEQLNILHRPLADLGIPTGAMVLVLANGGLVHRLLL